MRWLLALGAFFALQSVAHPCQWPTGTTVVFGEGYATITAPAALMLDVEGSPASGSFEEWRRSVRDSVAVLDSTALLLQQREVLRGGAAPGGRAAFNAMLSGAVATVRPLRCLEGLLYELVFDPPGSDGVAPGSREFLAFILEGEGFLQVFYVWGEDGEVNGSAATGAVDRALATGLRLTGHLHNHPFRLGARDVVGTLMPSPRDLDAFLRNMDLRGLSIASITNGFETADFRWDDVVVLRSAWESGTRK